MKYPDIFHTSNWKKATYEEKLAALQALENDYAARQGRPPCTIQPIELDPDEDGLEIGKYSYEDNTIFINKDLLNGLDPENKYAHMCNYLCVHTILHEGRHVYQNHAMNHDIHHNKEEVRKWRENLEIYYSIEPGLYRLQPLERDAHDYAVTEMNKIFANLERSFGRDRWYEIFSLELAKEKIDAKISALNHFGLNYIQKIDQKISDEYKKKMEKKLAPKKLPDLSKKSPEDVLESFNFWKDSSQSQNETVKSRVRDFISEAVEERKALFEAINRKDRESELER